MTTSIVESIRQLRAARAGALVQQRDLLATAPNMLRESITAGRLSGKLNQ